MILSFSGNDGAGKSTVAKHIESLFINSGVKTNYREEFEHFLLKYFLRLFKEKVTTERRVILKRRATPKGIYKFWPVLVFFDSILGNIYYRVFKNSTSTILDRCTYDHLASFEYLRCINKLVRRLFLSFRPADVSFVLDAPPEIMYKRKKLTHRYPLSFYKEQQQRYVKIADSVNLPTIKTHGRLSMTLENILRRIAFYLSNRIEDLLIHILSDPLKQNSLRLDAFYFRNIDLKYLLTESSRNNVEFQVINALLDHDYTTTSKSQHELAKILKLLNSKMMGLVGAIQEIVEIASKKSIDYVIFKTLASFKTHLRDIDILVDRPKEFSENLRSRGWKITETHRIHDEVSLAKNNVKIDLHWKIGWMGSYPVNSDVLLRSYERITVQDSEVRVPKPEYELLLVIAHALLQHHYLNLEDVHRIRSIVFSRNIHWARLFKMAEKAKILDGIMYILGLVKAKDLLFYQGKTFERIPKIPVQLINIKNAARLIGWIPSSFIPYSGAKGILDKMLHIPRRFRWSLTRKLPFNEPLQEIIEIDYI